MIIECMEFEYVVLSYFSGSLSFPLCLIALNVVSDQRASEGSATLYVSPSWRTLIEQRDMEYVSELLLEFSEDCKEDGAKLIKRLSNLQLGVVRTKQAGSATQEQLAILKRQISSLQ